MGADAAISVEVEGPSHVGVVEVRRGPNNFFDIDVLTGLADACDELGAGGDVRAIVLCSEGKHFCAGADFSGQAGRTQRQNAGGPHLYDIAARLFAQPLPVVAAVQGAAVGGGLGLALTADFRVAGPSSRFTANFALLGFHQGFGLSETLPRLVGQQAAADLLYTGRRIDGEAAHRIGLVDRLVADDGIRAEATALAIEIAAAGPLAVRAIRATLRTGLVDRVTAAMAHERAEQERLQQTDDFREGVAAVAARRPANFTGR
jgi:2-(1,2-epoxy-1,2-dihydrophenyl)acetyl-CoA isomerase